MENRTGRLRRLAGVAALAAPLVASAAATANDSIARLDGEGLTLMSTERVAMVEEDLSIAVDRVAVDYLFRNLTSADVTATVAFPLPSIDVSGALFAGGAMVAFPEAPDFVGFRLTVDGQPVTATLHQRARLADGRDVTDRLRTLGVPLSPFDPALEAVFVEPSEAPRLARLEALGLADQDGPTWTLETAYVWEQTFPAGRDLAVHHTYVPVAGGTILPIDLPEEARWFREAFCVDDPTWAGLRRRATDGVIQFQDVGYRLTTAAGWAGPIRRFRLTLDKGRPESLVTLCWSGLRKTSPTTFVFEAADFVPERDLAVAFVPAAP